MPAESADMIDLWTCLHDGEVIALRSDLMARTLTFVINSPFHWEFHRLPDGTRFELIGEDVRSTEAFSFEPWPGAIDPPREMPWEEAQEIRRRDGKLGRLVSSDWNNFASQVGTAEEYIVMGAETSGDALRLDVMSYPNSNYQQIEIRAKRFRFQVGTRELSLEEFILFGKAYWDDWANQSKASSSTDNPVA